MIPTEDFLTAERFVVVKETYKYISLVNQTYQVQVNIILTFILKQKLLKIKTLIISNQETVYSPVILIILSYVEKC